MSFVCTCALKWFLMLCVHLCVTVYVQAHVPYIMVCVGICVPLTLSGHCMSGAVWKYKWVHVVWVRMHVHFHTAERRVRPGVMSDARGGFLPASLLACWLTNGLLSGLADRLAGSQWLRLPYLVVVGDGGWWWQGSGWWSSGVLFTRRVRRSEHQSAMKQTQIT